jgi:FKBP-type peptidyl-prolyl cis-trans isomerase
MKNKCLLLLVIVSFSACKNKPKKKLEELPTKVEQFNPNTYRQCRLDDSAFALMERFGSVYDSSVFQAEIDTIAKWMEAQELKEIYHTRSGVVYAVKKYGRGNYPVAGDRLHVFTETRTWNGKVIFSSSKYKQPLEFVLGTGQVVPAWDEVLPNLPEGTEALIVAPSAMSYGKKNIPKVMAGNTILIYDIKFDKLIPDKDTKTKGRAPALQLDDDKIPVTLRRPDNIQKKP